MSVRRPPHDLDAAARASTAYLAGLARMDEEALVALFAADAIVHLPAGSPAVHGRAAVRELIRCVFAAAEPLEVAEDLVVGAVETVAVKWTGRWRTMEGDVSFGGIDVFSLDADGQISGWWAHWDRSAFLRA